MNAAVRTTLVLLVVLLALVGADVGVRALSTPDVIELPRLADLELASTRRVRLTRGGEIIELERLGDSGEWNLVEPVQGPADKQAVRDVLARLRGGLPMQVKVDTGNLAQYGLESGTALRLQVYEDGQDSASIDVYVGGDTVGGTSFVRFPDSDVVYRAQLGGRFRLDKAARDWRDPTVLAFDAGGVRAVTFAPGNPMVETLRFVRDGGRWTLDGVPGFPADQTGLTETLTRLGSLRAGAVLPGDFPLPAEPALRVRIERDGLDDAELTFYVEGRVAYVRVSGRTEVFQVAAGVPARLIMPRQGWLDRQLLDVDRASIYRMTYHDALEGDFVLEQDAADSSWRMVQPPNIDANLRESMQAAIYLSTLRSEGIAAVDPASAGFPSDNWIELVMRDGRTHRLELGLRTPDRDGQPTLLFVRTSDLPDRVGVMPLQDLLRIRQAWSK